MLNKLRQLQEDIYKYSINEDNEYIVNYSPKLSFFEGELLIYVSYFYPRV